MPYWFYVVLVVSFFVVAAATILFLLGELRKKFGFMEQFARNSNQMIRHFHTGAKRGEMRRLTFTWDKPFSILVGFELSIFGKRGFDYYGHATSHSRYVPSERRDEHTVTIETWFGKRPAVFAFMVNQSLANGGPTIVEGPAIMPPVSARYEPHWFQKYFGI